MEQNSLPNVNFGRLLVSKKRIETSISELMDFLEVPKGQLRSFARLRLAILNGCGKAAGNFQIVLCPLYIVLSNINLLISFEFLEVTD